MVGIVIIIVVVAALGGYLGYQYYFQPATKTSVSWILDFSPVGYMAPIYAAQQYGFFAKNGIDANIIVNPTGSVNAIEQVANGKAMFGDADFGTLLVSMIKNNITNVRVVGTFLQNGGGAGIFYLKNQRISKPSDLNGKVIGEATGAVTALFPTFCKLAGVNYSSLQIQQVSFASLETGLVAGKFDAIVGIFKEHFADPIFANNSNIGFFDYGTYGISVYGVSLITTAAMIQNSPTLVSNVVKSFYEGVQRTFQSQQNLQNAVGAMVNATTRLSNSVELSQWNIMSGYFGNASQISSYPNPLYIGWINPSTASTAISIIANAYGISAPNASLVYTDQFVAQPPA